MVLYVLIARNESARPVTYDQRCVQSKSAKGKVESAGREKERERERVKENERVRGREREKERNAKRRVAFDRFAAWKLA